MIFNILNKYKVEVYDKEAGEEPFIKVNNKILSEDRGLCDRIKKERNALYFIIQELCECKEKIQKMYDVFNIYTADKLIDELNEEVKELFDYEIELNKKDRFDEIVKEKSLTAADIELIKSLL